MARYGIDALIDAIDNMIDAIDAEREAVASMGEDGVSDDDGLGKLFDEIGHLYPCENPF